MAQITKIEKIIDITLLGQYDVLIKQYLQDKVDAINETIGTVPAKVGEGENEKAVANLIEYLQKSVELVNADATALTKRVEANEKEVQTTLPAYIDAAAAAAIAKVVGGASEDYDTLQEFEAWLLSDSIGAEAMKKAIKTLQGNDGTTQTKDSASIPGVKLYIDSLVDNKNVDAAVAEGELLLTAAADDNVVTVGSTAKLQTAVTRAENSVQDVAKDEANSKETYVSVAVDHSTKAVKVSIDDTALSEKIDGMYTDMQGNTEETVASIETKVNYLQLAEKNDIRALFGLDPE